MICTIVNVHVLNKATTKAVLGKHSLHHLNIQGMIARFEVFVERFLHQHLGSGDTLTARIAGIREVFTVGKFLTGELYLISVDDNHIVATLHVGRIAGLVLAAKDFGNFCAQTAKNLVGGINYHPLMLY